MKFPACVAQSFAAIIMISAFQGGILSGQQSYRTKQAFSRNSRNSPGKPLGKPVAQPAPRFRGFNYARKHQPEFVDYFLSRASRTGLAPVVLGQGRRLDSSSPLPAILPGLQFRPTAPAGALPTALATGDFNRDGHLDYVVANGGSNDLYMYFGNGDGTFQLPIIVPLIGISPVALAAVDLRGAGTLDLAVTYSDSQTLGILLGNGDGTFGPESEIVFPPSDMPVAVAAGDFNGDGKTDLVVGLNTYETGSTNAFYVFLGDGTGKFPTTIIIPMGPHGWEIANSISVGDINKDGKLDLLINNWNGETYAEIWLGNGDGTFQPGQSITGGLTWGNIFAADMGDINGDGCLDVAIAVDIGYSYEFLGNCDGTFQNPVAATGSFPIGDLTETIRLADFNADGHLDIVTAGIYQQSQYGVPAGNLLSVLFGDGTGNFSQAHVYRGEPDMVGLAVADFLGTGHPDVVTANQSDDTSTVFLNDGHGGFGDPQGMTLDQTTPAVGLAISGLLAADLNGDGKQDLVVMEAPASGAGVNRFAALINDGTGKLLPAQRYSTGANYLPGGESPDFVLADFRHTGRPDVLAIYSSGTTYMSFLPNNGDGTFGTVVVTPLSGIGFSPVLGVGDFNGDGKLDLVVASTAQFTYQQTLSIFLGNGDGTFNAGGTITYGGTTPQFASAIFVGDFNRDGKQDVLVWLTYNVVGSSFPLYEFRGKGDGTFNPPQMLFSNLNPFTVLDLNHDGWPDLIEEVSTDSSDDWLFLTFNIYIGQADGTFLLTNSYQPYQTKKNVRTPYPVVGDFNGDGNADVAVTGMAWPAAEEMAIWMLMGNGDGTFTPTYDTYPLEKILQPDQLLAVDLRGNGSTDLIELDNIYASYNIVRAGPASALQLTLTGTPGTGPLGGPIISLNLPPASTANVTLTSSDPGVIVPPTVEVPAGSLTQTFSYIPGAALNSQRVIAVTATLGTDTATAYGVSPFAHASLVASLSLQPSGTITFPSVAAGASGTPLPVTLTSSGNSAMILEGFSIFPEAFSGQWNCPRLLYPGASCTLQIAFTPQSPGAASAVLMIDDNSAITDELVLEGQSQGIASPVNVTSVTFPGQPVGTTSAVQPVVLQNTSQASISITSIAVSGAPFAQTNNCSTSLSGPGSCTISVTFSPTQTGPASGTLTIVAGAIGSPYVISLSGTGQTPAPVLSATTLQFNSVGVNSTSSPLSLTITASQAALALQSITTTGDFAQTNTCPSSLAVGAFCTVNVTFTPTTTGARQGTLVLSDNGSGSPQTVPLSGTGVDFNLTQGSGSSTSATVSPGQLATYTLSLAGSGGTVSFSCTGAPSDSTCSVSPTPVTLGTSATPITISVSTTAASLGPPRSRPFPLIPPAFLRFTNFLMLLALPLMFVGATAFRQRRGVNYWRYALVPLAGLMLALSACGGGGGGGGSPTNPGTPAGTYSLTVTGTMPVGSSTITHTMTLNLNVN